MEASPGAWNWLRVLSLEWGGAPGALGVLNCGAVALSWDMTTEPGAGGLMTVPGVIGLAMVVPVARGGSVALPWGLRPVWEALEEGFLEGLELELDLGDGTGDLWDLWDRWDLETWDMVEVGHSILNLILKRILKNPMIAPNVKGRA